MVVLQKILIYYRKYEGLSILDQSKLEFISETLIIDLEHTLEQMTSKFKFSNEVLCVSYPKFLISTQYDKYFVVFDIKIRAPQQQLLDFIRKTEIPQFLIYKSMIGSGKTSVSLGITILVQQMRELAGDTKENDRAKT